MWAAPSNLLDAQGNRQGRRNPVSVDTLSFYLLVVEQLYLVLSSQSWCSASGKVPVVGLLASTYSNL